VHLLKKRGLVGELATLRLARAIPADSIATPQTPYRTTKSSGWEWIFYLSVGSHGRLRSFWPLRHSRGTGVVISIATTMSQ